MTPLNGTKTHPLTEHGWRALEMLFRGAVPAQVINAGVVNRLLREDLAELYLAPTPYRTRKGNISWLRITQTSFEKVIGRPRQKPPGLRRKVSAPRATGAGRQGEPR